MNEKKIAPASRVATVKEYYLQRKMQEVAALNADGLDIVSLGIGGPDRPAPDSAVEHLKLSVSNPANHGYQISKGIPALREAYAQWYKEKYGATPRKLDRGFSRNRMPCSSGAKLHFFLESDNRMVRIL